MAKKQEITNKEDAKLLTKLYFKVFKEKINNEWDFYDSIFFESNLNPNVKSKRIGGSSEYPKDEKSNYERDDKKRSVLNKMKKLVKKSDNMNDTISEIMKVINEEISLQGKKKCTEEKRKVSRLKKLLIYLSQRQTEEYYTYFYYELFKYCITGMAGDIEPYDIIKIAYKEFYEDIVKKYGISGTTASMIILQKAQRIETTNPIILYEAAQIEFKKGKESNKEAGDHFQKAYDYYERAFKSGLPLAQWDMGYLAQSSYAHYIREFAGKTDEERLKIAMRHFEESKKKGCIRAINSIGNIYYNRVENKETGKVNVDSKDYKKARKYYKQAAEKNEIHGMNNYAMLLEKEIKNYIDEEIHKNNGKYDEAFIKDICFNNAECKDKIVEMMNYFEKAAKEGYPRACYRYALYCTEINYSDKEIIFPNNIKFPIPQNKISFENSLAIYYIDTAIRTTEEQEIKENAEECLSKMKKELPSFF